MQIGFIGFGEAGYRIARGLRAAGAPPLVAFDINANTPGLGERIRQRAADTGTRLAESSEDLARSVQILLSVVTAESALAATTQTRPFLTPSHLYVDLNSVSPATKRRIAAELATTGMRFVEAAIMAPVPPLGHRVPVLLNGEWAAELMEAMAPFDMRLERMHKEIGAAAAVKMCRSVVVKGLEALMLECALTARKYDATDRVFDSLHESFPGIQWRETADYMIGRVLEHGERRAREMEEVADTMRAVGVEPIMAEAAARRQDWEARLREAGWSVEPEPSTVEELLNRLGGPAGVRASK